MCAILLTSAQQVAPVWEYIHGEISRVCSVCRMLCRMYDCSRARFLVGYWPDISVIILAADFYVCPSLLLLSSASSPFGPVDYFGGALWRLVILAVFLLICKYAYDLDTCWDTNHSVFCCQCVLLRVHLSSRVRRDAGHGLQLSSRIHVWRFG